MCLCDLVVPIKDCQMIQHENIHMCWIVDAKFGIPHLAFELNGQQVWAIHQDLKTMVPSMVTKGVFVVVESLVKNQCKGKPCNFLPFILLPHIFFFSIDFFSLSCKQ